MTAPTDTNRTSEPNLADYIAKWSKRYLAPSAQEMGAREEYASDLARYLRGEISRLRRDFARIYQAIIDNPEKLTIADIARIAAGNAS